MTVVDWRSFSAVGFLSIFLSRGALLGCVVGAASTGAAAGIEAPAHARILATIATGQPGIDYQLALGPCGGGPCLLSIRLARGGSVVLQTEPLEWPSPSKRVRLEAVGAGWGVGDVLGPPPRLRGWTADFDEKGDATVVRRVRLSAQRMGLLVTQRMGVEPAKRVQSLYVTEHGELKQAWVRKEGSGPTWSTTSLVPFRGDQEQILYVAGYSAGSEGGGPQADTLEATAIRWDEELNKVVELPAPAAIPLQLVWFGVYPTVAAAVNARAEASCLFQYWILDAGHYAGLPKGYVIGAITGDPARAQRARADAAQCTSSSRGAIVPLKLR